MLEIQKFEQEIKKKLPKHLYFCYAQEEFFLFEAARLIRKNFDSISIETYESVEEIDLTSFASSSLFSQKRILLVYNFEKIKKAEKRIEWLKKVIETRASSATVCVLCNASYKDISEEVKFLKNLDDLCRVYNLDIQEKDLPAWIIYKLREFGKTAKPDAIFYLIDITGGQPGLISSEIEKIALLTEKPSIGLFEIKDILTELGEFTPFDLIDAIKKKDTQRAFTILNKLQNTERDMILGALNWYYANKTDAGQKVYSLLYRTNLALRQARSCALEMLVYELMKE